MLHLSSDPVFTRLPNGRPAWYIAAEDRYLPYISGGDGDEPAEEPSEEEPSEPAEEPAAEEPAADDKPLGEKGENALNAMKEQVKKLKADLKAARDEAGDLKRQQMTEQERAVEDARIAGREEALQEAHSTLFRAELRAQAAGKLQAQAIQDLTTDAAVAMRSLGFEQVPVTSTGEVDGEAISRAVDEYVTARPYLSADATSPGPINQGPRHTPPPKGIAEQIAEAESKGDFKTTLALKAQQAAALPRS